MEPRGACRIVLPGDFVEELLFIRVFAGSHRELSPPQKIFHGLHLVCVHFTRPAGSITLHCVPPSRCSDHYCVLILYPLLYIILVILNLPYFSNPSILIFRSFSLFRTFSISFRSICLCMYTLFSSIWETKYTSKIHFALRSVVESIVTHQKGICYFQAWIKSYRGPHSWSLV